MKIEDMVVLMDGTQADPDDVSRGKDGVLRHKNGVPVAIGEDGEPETIGKRTARNASAANAGKQPEAKMAVPHPDDVEAAAMKDEPADDTRSPVDGQAANNPT